MRSSPLLNRFITLSLSLVLLATAASACGAQPSLSTDGKLLITVSIMPQKYFVERIGGEYVAVNVMVGLNADPHVYEPKPEQMRALSRSAAYMSIGVEFEDAWLEKIAAANPHMLMVDTIAGIERIPLGAHQHGEAEEASGGERHDDPLGAPDPHVWLSPQLVKLQVQIIYEALVKLDPTHHAVYQANRDAFIADIDQLEADIERALSGIENRRFMVFHPAWGYLAHDFGLEQIAIEVGGQEPSARELATIIQKAREESIRVIFAQPEFSTRAAETIAQEIGGEVLLISPLDPNWLENMRRVAETFAAVLNK